MLLKWDLEDTAKLLAKHGWKSVSRLKRFNSDTHMGELGLSSGAVCTLEALLQSPEGPDDDGKQNAVDKPEQEKKRKKKKDKKEKTEQTKDKKNVEMATVSVEEDEFSKSYILGPDGWYRLD